MTTHTGGQVVTQTTTKAFRITKATLPDLLAFGTRGQEEALLVVKELMRRYEKRLAKRAERAAG